MNKNYNFLLKDISKLKNIGKKTALILKKKNINSIFDMLWRLPQSYTDRSNISKTLSNERVFFFLSIQSYQKI